MGGGRVYRLLIRMTISMTSVITTRAVITSVNVDAVATPVFMLFTVSVRVSTLLSTADMLPESAAWADETAALTSDWAAFIEFSMLFTLSESAAWADESEFVIAFCAAVIAAFMSAWAADSASVTAF